jgi:hypothetical protein
MVSDAVMKNASEELLHLQFDTFGIYCDHAGAKLDTDGEVVDLAYRF